MNNSDKKNITVSISYSYLLFKKVKVELPNKVVIECSYKEIIRKINYLNDTDLVIVGNKCIEKELVRIIGNRKCDNHDEFWEIMNEGRKNIVDTFVDKFIAKSECSNSSSIEEVLNIADIYNTELNDWPKRLFSQFFDKFGLVELGEMFEKFKPNIDNSHQRFREFYEDFIKSKELSQKIGSERYVFVSIYQKMERGEKLPNHKKRISFKKRRYIEWDCYDMIAWLEEWFKLMKDVIDDDDGLKKVKTILEMKLIYGKELDDMIKEMNAKEKPKFTKIGEIHLLIESIKIYSNFVQCLKVLKNEENFKNEDCYYKYYDNWYYINRKLRKLSKTSSSDANIISCTNYFAHPKLYKEEFHLKRIADGNLIKFKLIICTIGKESLISNTVNSIIQNVAKPEYGMLHPAILIGNKYCNLYLEWDKSGFIKPKKSMALRAIACFDIGEVKINEKKMVEFVNDETIPVDDIINPIAELCTQDFHCKEYNVKIRNCQHFIDAIILKLSLEKRFPKGGILNNIDWRKQIRKTNNVSIDIQGIGKIDLKSFKTHKDVDIFSYVLDFYRSPKLNRFIGDEFKLLKALDRSFWLRYEMSNADEHKSFTSKDKVSFISALKQKADEFSKKLNLPNIGEEDVKKKCQHLFNQENDKVIILCFFEPPDLTGTFKEQVKNKEK